jgi:nitrate reductase NapD
MSHLCISSLVVQARPAMLAAVRDRLSAIPEAEVLGENREGKLVVVIDAPGIREAANRISEIQDTDGVLAANLIFQYDDQFKTQAEDSV